MGLEKQSSKSSTDSSTVLTPAHYPARTRRGRAACPDAGNNQTDILHNHEAGYVATVSEVQTQLGNHLPMLALLACCSAIDPRDRAHGRSAPQSIPYAGHDRRFCDAGKSLLDTEKSRPQSSSVTPNEKMFYSSHLASGRAILRPRFTSAIGAGLGLMISLSAVLGAAAPALDWPLWRGPTGDGLASPGQNPPVEWSETQGILWKVAIPGRGHGSPTVVGDHIYLATADPVQHTQSVLCLERQSGKVVWQTEVHGGRADPGKHSNSSAASSTVACDGERLFINFLNGGAVQTTALSLDGKILWQRTICDYVVHQGFASSPVIHESLVLVSADNRGGGVVAGLDRKTGQMVWSEPRPKLPNYTSPAILKAGGRTQMVLAGCNLITSLDPLTGRKLWEVNGSTEECVGSVVTDGVRVLDRKSVV